MKIPVSLTQTAATTLGTQALRSEFLVESLFQPGQATLRYWETDRTIVGGIMPTVSPVALPVSPELRATEFFARREGGIINIGGPGSLVLDGQVQAMAHLDTMYLGRGGSREVILRSDDPSKPARFYLLSYPAHAAYPNRHIPFASAPGDKLGSRETANERRLHKIIHPGAFPTCQLVMGITRLEAGSVWNTMPPHTHTRRSEVYLYFDVPEAHAVFHFMGHPQETRHLLVRDGQAVLSPAWSIHSGAGTTHYSFIWGMGGENQEFADMDAAPVSTLL